MKRRFPIIFLLFGCCIALTAATYTPATIPNPHTANQNNYTANPDGILSAKAVANINSIALTTDQTAEVEMAIVAIETMNRRWEAADFAQELFNLWGIGKKGKNTGVLILLVRHSRDIRIQTGGGMEGILTDAICSDILNNEMIPFLSDNKWDEGILAGAKAIQARVTETDALQELLLGYRPADTTWISIVTGYFCLSFLLLILLAVLAYRELNNNTSAPNNIRYRQAQTTLYIHKICALFFPVPCALFWIWYKKAVDKLRLRPVVCPQCKHIMQRLSEQEEDRFLSSAEQSEEDAESVDYDVWLCPSCNNHLILPYNAQQTIYTPCPHCGTITYALQNNVILQDATQFRNGTGEKTYHCRHCGHTDKKRYILPKIPVVITTGGNGRGGGFSGGSFGGGISFGGGAGGKF